MDSLSFYISNKFYSLKRIEPETVFHFGDKLIIKHDIIEKNFKISIELSNPFNYIINHFLLDNSSKKTTSIHFNEFMPSGRYFFKILPFFFSDSISDLNDQTKAQFFSFQFIGSFQNFNWILTYAVNCTAKRGMEIRLAAPKQYFPFFHVKNLEGKPSNTITTDVWSNWLLLDTTNKIGLNDIMFGYRSNVYSNYLIFNHHSLHKHITNQNPDLINFLKSEQGIETSDESIKNFSEKINSKSVFGIIHNILFFIESHLRFVDQLGEFGAKYALLNKQGDCTEYSALFTTLCRIKKIPSRLVAGLKKVNSTNQFKWIRHAWSEIYYEGLWIPIDVVEAKSKIIGFHPDLIPLFKGNWMVENMNREIKISLLDEFKTNLSTNDLIEAYSSLAISYKVQIHAEDHEQANFDYFENISFDPIEIVNESDCKCNSETEITLIFSELQKNCTLGIYFKALTDASIKSPKIVYYLEHITEIIPSNYSFKIHTPENPGLYELGLFVCSIYGEIISWNSVDVNITC